MLKIEPFETDDTCSYVILDGQVVDMVKVEGLAVKSLMESVEL